MEYKQQNQQPSLVIGLSLTVNICQILKQSISLINLLFFRLSYFHLILFKQQKYFEHKNSKNVTI